MSLSPTRHATKKMQSHTSADGLLTGTLQHPKMPGHAAGSRLEKSATLKPRSTTPHTPGSAALLRPESTGSLRLGRSASATWSSGEAPASRFPQADSARSLLRSITDVNAIGEVHESRVIYAIDSWLQGRLPLGQFARDVNATDEHGSTLLMVAACFGKLYVVHRLLRAGAKCTLTNHIGRCALVYACMGPDLPAEKAQIIEMLLSAGARGRLSQALETSALLGRSGFVRILTAFGALPKGQLVSIRRPPQGSSMAVAFPPTPDRNSPRPLMALPDFHRAMARVVEFDVDNAMYTCDVLAIRDPHDPNVMTPAAFRISVSASQIHVALHHIETESAAPILAQGHPLDVAAASYAGARKSIAPSLTDDVKVFALLQPGMPVRVVGRPEQWLNGQPGIIHSWDAQLERYMVLLPELGWLNEEAGVPDFLPLLLPREHVEHRQRVALDVAKDP